MIGDRVRIVRRSQGHCDVRCAVGQGDNAPVITASEITAAIRSAGALAAFSFSQKGAMPTEISGSAVVMIASTGEMRMPSRKAFWLNRKPGQAQPLHWLGQLRAANRVGAGLSSPITPASNVQSRWRAGRGRRDQVIRVMLVHPGRPDP